MRLLILGTGRMAHNHMRGYQGIDGLEVVGAVDTSPDGLAAFADEWGIGQRFGTLDAALAWGQFDAVDNITPDAIHHPTTMAVLAAGKHVFCEKPLATNYALAKEMVDAAEAAGVVNMVNLTYRNVAELHKAREIIASGAIGTVKHIEASYLQHWVALRDFSDPGPWLWRLSSGHGSNGTLGDIGIHILDFTMFATGLDVTAMHCRLQTFGKVEGDRLGEYVLDANDSFVISAGFSNGAIGTIHSSRWASGHANDQRLRVYGEKGGLELSHGHWGTLLRVSLGEDVAAGTWREVQAEPVKSNYRRFAEAVDARITEVPEDWPSFRHAAKLQRLLDLALLAGQDRNEHQV
jgi:predicted dehydrogenase